MSNNLGRFVLPTLLGAAIGAGLIYLLDNEPRGGFDLYGDDPKSEVKKPAEYKPRHFAVVYMKFGENPNEPRLIAKHAYFDAGETEAKDNVGCAIRSLQGKPNDGDNCPLAKGSKGEPGTIRQDFSGFAFGKQMRIYGFVDNSKIAFNNANPVAFTPYGAFDNPADSKTEKKSQNKSFYAAKSKDVVFADLNPKNGQKYSGLRMDNILKNGNGGALGEKEEAKHSINFNLVLCKQSIATCSLTEQNSETLIPLVIDPDGNNMGGGTPPP